MVYLLIDGKNRYNISNLNNKELLEVVGQLDNHDIKIFRVPYDK